MQCRACLIYTVSSDSGPTLVFVAAEVLEDVDAGLQISNKLLQSKGQESPLKLSGDTYDVRKHGCLWIHF